MWFCFRRHAYPFPPPAALSGDPHQPPPPAPVSLNPEPPPLALSLCHHHRLATIVGRCSSQLRRSYPIHRNDVPLSRSRVCAFAAALDLGFVRPKNRGSVL
ncbi:hypothetical protein CsSME_00039539 [Camellia sinensis var. sinensis]